MARTCRPMTHDTQPRPASTTSSTTNPHSGPPAAAVTPIPTAATSTAVATAPIRRAVARRGLIRTHGVPGSAANGSRPMDVDHGAAPGAGTGPGEGPIEPAPDTSLT